MYVCVCVCLCMCLCVCVHVCVCVTTLLVKVGNERNGLDGLAQTHFISQDGVNIMPVQEGEPIQPDKLIRLELASTVAATAPAITKQASKQSINHRERRNKKKWRVSE